MADLHRAGRYDRMTDDVFAPTGQKPLSMQEFARNNAATFTDSAKAAIRETATSIGMGAD
jgi:hypothetical protein